MKKEIALSLILLFIYSCSSTKVITPDEFYDSFKEYNTYSLISLDTVKDKNRTYVKLENLHAVILFSTYDILEYAINNIKNDTLCEQKRKSLKSLIDFIKAEENYDLLIKIFSPEKYYEYVSYRNYRNYRKSYIEPYNYEFFANTLDKNKIIGLQKWITNDICLSGKCLILDKRTKTFVDKIYYIITDFKDGHGGESLNFADKYPFYSVAVYTDILWPDFDCMSEKEIKEFQDNLKSFQMKRHRR